MLCDEQAELGGSLLAETAARIEGEAGAAWLPESVAALRRNARVTLLPRTTAFGYFPHNLIGLNERLTDHLAKPRAGRRASGCGRCAPATWCSRPARSSGRWCFRATTGRASCWRAPRSTYLNRYGVLVGRRVVVVDRATTAPIRPRSICTRPA